MIKQISIFARNQPGKISKITNLLGNNNINIKVITIDRGTDYGAIKLIVDKPDKATKIFNKNNIPLKVTEVLVIKMNGCTGGIPALSKLLSSKDINLQDAYGFVTEKNNISLLAIEISDPKKVKQILGKENIKVLSDEAVYNI